MNKKILFIVLVIGLLAFTSIRRVIAETEREDNEKDREDRYENEEHEDDNWDLSDDFNQPVAPKEVPTERVIIKKIIVQPKIPENLTTPVNMTFESKINLSVPEINESLYKDDDNDGIMNRDDKYPGENDLVYIDSDNDGIVDAKDIYHGKNDLDFQDIDKDGVIDSRDSDLNKKTDMDHDGIDDKYDKKDDRSFMVKIMELLGIVNQ